MTRAPGLAAIQQLNARALTASLTRGVMKQQAAGLSRPELRDVIDYLAARESHSDAWYAGMMCGTDDRTVVLNERAAFSMFGVDHHSSRNLSADAAGLTSAQLSKLELAWAIGFPDTNGLRAAPAIVGNTLFYTPTQTGRLLALEVTVPCVQWVYDAGARLRSSVTYGELGEGGAKALVFADSYGQVHAVDPVTGSRLWIAPGTHSQDATITGAPVLYKGKIIVPISASGVGRGADPEYECCAEHGAVRALDAATGETLWTYHTMKDAEYTGKTSRIGVRLRGPSGAPIWSSPTIDAKRGLVYVTTGENTSLPATATSDAVLALDIETGRLRWGFQALADDVWIMSCRIPWASSGPNCPSPEDSVLKDFDFGAAAVLIEQAEGDILLAGQKSGDVWALDPDTGRLLWNRRIGEGSPLGGVHWGLAVDGRRVFVPINDPIALPGVTREPGMNALDIRSGEVLWRQPVTADCSSGRGQRMDQCEEKYGLSAAPLVIDQSVVAASIDGRLYVYDAATGAIDFEFDTLRDFDTINAVPGKGGAIDSHSIFAGAGMLFVGSGYGSFRQPPGNVLLAFRPRRSAADLLPQR